MKFQNPSFKSFFEWTDKRTNETVFMWLRFRILDTYVASCLCVA